MYENFEKLLKMHNVTAYKVAKDTKIANSTFSDWKKGLSVPKTDKISKIAEYFNVSLGYLLGTETKSNDITFNDFTYAMHNEGQELTQEEKDELLRLAKLFNQKRKEKQNKE